MVTAVESAIQDASKAIDTSGAAANSSEALQMGMSLAQRQQQIEQKRQEIDFQRAEQEKQKGDWLHSQMSAITVENDPKIRAHLVDNLAELFPKMFDGRRFDPAQQELFKKSDSFIDKAGALTRVRKMMAENNFAGISEYDKGIVNGMSSADIAQQLGNLNNIHKNEDTITKALIQSRIATQSAAEKAGTSKEELQQTMNQNNPMAFRKASVDLRADDQASRAGSAYDKSLQKLYVQKQALDRASHTLTDPNTPITPQIFREAEKEFVTAMTGSGATGLSQSEKTEYNNMHLKMAETLQKYGNKMVDLRKVAPELVNQLLSSNKRLSEAYGENMEDTVSKVDKNFSESSNPKVQAMRRAKTKDYAPKYHAEKFGDEADQEPEPGVNPGLAGVPQSATPKPSQSDMEAVDNQARERLRQARAAQKAGLPLSFTEQQVKDTYKKITGRDLVE